MWHRPNLLNALADLLFAAAAATLLVAAAIWVLRTPFSPVREVVFSGPLRHVQAGEVEQVLQGGLLAGNFLSLNVDRVRDELERLPWVRRVEIRRVWPSRLEIFMEEQKAVARWGMDRGELVNSYGEVFAALLPDEDAAKLPLLYGPPGTADDLLRSFSDFAAMLKPIGRTPRQLVLSQRLAWQLVLDNGLQIELGREQGKAPVATRLQRFVAVYPETVGARGDVPQAVDLRYPNGFALRVAAGHPDVRGKQ
jgi:cell division protein FtsQ